MHPLLQAPTSTPVTSAGGSAVTSKPGSGSGGSGSNSGSPGPTSSPNSAAGPASLQSWERTVTSVGLAIVFSLVGAAVVL